ncbi:MAG TPA: hypothetical protein VM266_13745 [Solirubrobacteraceae bacterium]|nr:hypothetical protein [Solirubrobacteraceae bacterium]
MRLLLVLALVLLPAALVLEAVFDLRRRRVEARRRGAGSPLRTRRRHPPA